MEFQIEVNNEWLTVTPFKHYEYKGNKRLLKDITHLKN